MAKILVNKNGQALMSADGKVYKGAVEQVIPEGYIKPTGKIEITTTEEIDVSNYAKAQIVDSNLEPQNIVKDVTILGVTGTFDGGSSGSMAKQYIEANNGSASSMFNGFLGLSVDSLIKYSDTENIKDFSKMYNDCKKITTFPLIDTSNGTNFSYMYYTCSSATSFPQIDTSNGENFSYMYCECGNVTSFAINTNLAVSLSNMFYRCTKATKIDITKFNFSSTSSSNKLCSGCFKLKAFIIRSFGASYVLSSNSFGSCYFMLGQTHSTYNPNGEQGYIYVPRAMIETLQNETNWSAMQFRALEDYTKDGTTTGEFDDEKAGLV